jgi:hypothetical protein
MKPMLAGLYCPGRLPSRAEDQTGFAGHVQKLKLFSIELISAWSSVSAFPGYVYITFFPSSALLVYRGAAISVL